MNTETKIAVDLLHRDHSVFVSRVVGTFEQIAKGDLVREIKETAVKLEESGEDELKGQFVWGWNSGDWFNLRKVNA